MQPDAALALLQKQSTQRKILGGASPNKKSVWIQQSRLNVQGEQEPSLKEMIKTFLTDENTELLDDKQEQEAVSSPKRRDTIGGPAGTASPGSGSPRRKTTRKQSMHQAGAKMSGNSIDYENSQDYIQD